MNIDPTTLVPCPSCKGMGDIDLSDCCEARITDDDHCTECGLTCEKMKCPVCMGSGEVTPIERRTFIDDGRY